MANPWENDAVVGPAPWDNDAVIADTPELMWNTLNTGDRTKDFLGGLGYGFAQPFLPEDNLATIASKMIPGSRTEYDEKTDTWYVVRPDGTRQAVNKPGFSKADVINLGGLAATMGGEGALLKTAQQVGPQVARVGNWLWNTAKGQGTVAGATRAGQEALGDVAAGEQVDIPWGGVLADTFAGGIGTKLFNGLTRTAARTGRRVESVWRDWFDDGGQITKTGREALESIGVRPDDLTQDQIRRVNATAPLFRGYPEQAQGRAALLAAHDVRPTMGMVTQDPGLQMSEDVIIKTPGSMRGGAQLARFDQQAHQRVADEANRMFPPEASIAPAQRRLVGMQNRIAESFNASFQNLREAGAETKIDPDAFLAIMEDLKQRAVGVSSLRDVERLGIFDKKMLPKAIDGEIDFREMLSWRRDVAKMGPVGQEVANAFDEGLEMAQQMMLMRGDPDVVPFARKLHDAYKAYKKEWGANDLFGRLIRFDNQKAHLAVSPEEATNFLLNSSESGWTTKQGLNQAVKKMKSVLGSDSDEFQQLKWAIGRRAIGAGTFKESVDGGIRTAGGTMRHRFQNAMMKRRQLMETLFAPEELRAMDYLTQVADLIQRKPGRGGALNSTTTLGMQNLQNLLINVLPTNEFQYIPAAVRLGTKGTSALWEKFNPGGPGVRKLLNPAGRGTGVPMPFGLASAFGTPDTLPEAQSIRDRLAWLLEDEDQE